MQCSAHEATTQTIDNLSPKERNLSSNTPSPTWLDYPSPEDSSLELYDDDEESDEKLASLEDEMEVLKYDLGEIMDEVDTVEAEIENTIEEENIKDHGELESLSDSLIVPLMDEEEDTNGNTDTTTKREKHKERRKKSTLGPQKKKAGGHKQKHNELQKARRKHHKEARENRIKKNQATHGMHNNEEQADQNIEPLVSHTVDMMNTQTASTKAAKVYPSDDTSLIQEQQKIAEEETMNRLIRKKKKIMEEEDLESITDGKARKLLHKRGRR